MRFAAILPQRASVGAATRLQGSVVLSAGDLGLYRLRGPPPDSGRVQRLSALDAGFLEAEDSDRHISLAIGAISVLDGPMPDFDAIEAEIAQRVASAPQLRKVLRTSPLELVAPEWVDDPTMDLDHHLRRAALPQPGDDAALFRFAAEAMEIRLDRDRPLWQCWVIEGLEGGRWAILLKIHHCIADGIAAMHVLAGLSDGGEGDTFASDIRAARHPDRPLLTMPDLSLNPLQWVRGAWHTASAVTAAAAQTVAGAAQVVDGLVHPGPPTPLTGPITSMRRYSAAGIPLADIEDICRTFKVTVNDVALAAITDSYRAALLRRGQAPRRDSLRTLVPVSVRFADAATQDGNRVSIMLPFLPVDLSDRVEQLQTVHRRLMRTKSSGQRQAVGNILSTLDRVPFPVAAWAVRAFARIPQRGFVTLATNVPGPRQQLTILGRNVTRLMPIPPVALRLRTGIAILSYADRLEFGVTADFDAAPDVDEIATGIEHAVHLLAVSARNRCTTDRPLTVVHTCEHCP